MCIGRRRRAPRRRTGHFSRRGPPIPQPKNERALRMRTPAVNHSHPAGASRRRRRNAPYCIRIIIITTITTIYMYVYILYRYTFIYYFRVHTRAIGDASAAALSHRASRTQREKSRAGVWRIHTDPL